MLTHLPSPKQMNAWDAATATLGLPTFTLMENAARAAFHVLHTCVANLKEQRVLILMGHGNNGGDAAALARMLHDDGVRVLVAHTRPLRTLRDITAKHVRLARVCGVPFIPVRHWQQAHPDTFPTWTTPDVLVDGLLGTGFTGILRQDMEDIIHEVNKRSLLNQAFVLALDVPSGLCAATGLVANIAIRANATVTFEAAKPGLVLPSAKSHTGTVYTRSIGMPAVIPQRLPATCALLDERIMQYQPASTTFTHKGKAGHVLILGGSTGLCGAPLLAAHGAFAAGAGKVTLAMPAPLLQNLSIPPDIMTLPLPTDTWQANDTLFNALQNILNLVDSLVLGPGIGRQEGSLAFIAHLLQNTSRPPTLIDADALYALAKNPRLYPSLTIHDVLTPHPHEAATLVQSSTASIQHERFASLAQLQALTPQHPVWVLKGAGTLVGQRQEAQPSCLVSPFDIPQLAVGGSGDVLAGVIATFMAQGLSAFHAAGLGVYRHAQAGCHMAKQAPYRGNTASDIAKALCYA